MRFQITGCVMRWLGPMILTLIGAVLIFGNPISLDYACRNTGNCLVSWVGALSGWAALVGALLTVGVMREQLMEQRNQTNQMRGDVDPEAFISRSVNQEDGKYHSEVKITVVNRNRRTLQLHSIEATVPTGFAIGVRQTTIGEQIEPMMLSHMIPMKYLHRTLIGKEDGERAERCVIDCHIFDGEGLARLPTDPDLWWAPPIEVKIHAFLKGAVDVAVVLHCSGSISLRKR